MNCPPDVAEIALEFLSRGLLRIRSAGWSGEARECAEVADGLHNLPGLVGEFSPDRLASFLENDSAACLDLYAGGDRNRIEMRLESLRRYTEPATVTAPGGPTAS